MKKKVIKISLMSMMTAAVAAAPIALAVSCGGSTGGSSTDGLSFKDLLPTDDYITGQVAEETAVQDQAANTEIEVGVRISEYNAYKAMADKFNTYGKGKVKIVGIDGNYEDKYNIQEATESLPTIFFVMGAKDEINGNHWLKPMDIQSFTGEENKALYDVTDGELSFDEDTILESHRNTVSNDHGVNFGLPTGYASNAIMMNMEAIDQTKTIKSYKPGTVDSRTPEVVNGTNGQPIDGGSCDYDGIQDYLMKAGDKDDATSVVDGTWLGYGPGNLLQRIYSVGKSCEWDGLNLSIMPIKERMVDVALWASAGVVQEDGSSWYDATTSTIGEDAFVNAVKSNNVDQHLVDYIWNSIFGYMQNDGFVTVQHLTGDGMATGEVEQMYNKHTLFNFKPKWAYKSINDNWAKDQNGLAAKINQRNGAAEAPVWAKKTDTNPEPAVTSGQMAVFASPYDTATGDSFGISKFASPAETLVAKRFLKFTEQTDAKFNITYDEVVEDAAGQKTTINTTKSPALAVVSKTISPTEHINTIQKQLATASAPITDQSNVHQQTAAKSMQAWYNAGKAKDSYNGVEGQVWAKFGPYWSSFESPFMSDMQKIYNQNDNDGVTKAEYTRMFGSVAAKFQAQIELG